MRGLSLAILLLVLANAGKTQDSPHGSNLTLRCKDCHSAKGWELDRKTYSFDHNSTSFPLVGQHLAINCKSCHPTLIFSEANTDCLSCHTDMHNQTVGMDCSRCHSPKSWLVENTTDLHFQSRFPLLGPHESANCTDCHQSASLLQFEPLGVECFDCHMPDYQSASSPNHVLGNISTNCSECHPPTAYSWGGAGFNHDNFPLTEGHVALDCNQCHTGTDYSNISAECFSCHQTDYNSTTNPDHLSSGISNVCMECHSTVPGWKPATFDHASFPLTQGHSINDCNQCHKDGNYSNVSSECISCHEIDFNATTNPNHLTSGIPDVCIDCHTTMPGWKPADFAMHDALFFPVYSGKHNGEWTSCTECHSDPTNYSFFSCIDCHEHNRAEMDDKHSGENSYEYNSLACLDCHPTGTGD